MTGAFRPPLEEGETLAPLALSELSKSKVGYLLTDFRLKVDTRNRGQVV